MSNEWTSARIDYVRHSQPSQREWHEALDEIERLQARVAELEADAPAVRLAGANDVIIPAAIIEKMVNDADFVAKAESLAYQHFPSLVTAIQAGHT